MADAAESFQIPRQSLQAGVLDRLRDEIIRGVWKPGERLQERLLCERYGISRSPLREAYQVLSAEGLLELSPNRGAVASSPSISDVMQNHVLIKALEVLAIGLATEHASDRELAAIAATHDEERRAVLAGDQAAAFRLNNELHRMIVLASHNRPLIEAHLLAHRKIVRIQNVNPEHRPEAAPPAAEHETFISALVRRDKATAIRAMQTHQEHIEDLLVSRLRQLADANDPPTAADA